MESNVSRSFLTNYTSSCIKQFKYYKSLADKSIATLSDEELFNAFYGQQGSENLNSVAVIVKHIAGNMKSRWTDVFTTDGEKEWRNRELEFEDESWSREQLLNHWEEAWKILFDLLDSLVEEDFSRIIYIRNMGHSLVEAMNRQLMHYSYHIGQIVLLAKTFKGDKWQSLSIAKGKSKAYNADKFSKEKSQKHFTEDL